MSKNSNQILQIHKNHHLSEVWNEWFTTGFPRGLLALFTPPKKFSRCKIHGHGVRWMKMPFGTASIFVWSCYLAFYALLFWGGHDSISEKILIVCWGWMFGSLNTGICDIVPESLSSQKEQAMLKLRIFLFKKIIRLFSSSCIDSLSHNWRGSRVWKIFLPYHEAYNLGTVDTFPKN